MEYTECCLWVSRVSQSLVLANRTAARTALSYCAPLPSFEPAMDTSGVPDPARYSTRSLAPIIPE
eukprot:1183005-Prorocentrum_minimum.AAC.6